MTAREVVTKSGNLSRDRNAGWYIALGATFLMLAIGRYEPTRAGVDLGFGAPLRLLLLAVLVPILLALRNVAPERTLNQRTRRYLGALTLLLLVLAVSSLWSPSGSDLRSPLLDIVFMWVTLMLAAQALRIANQQALSTALLLLFAWGLSYTLLAILTGGSQSRIAVLGGGPIIFGRVTGLSAIALVALVLLGRLRYRYLTLLPLLLAMTILSGSRGPIIATALGLLVLLPTMVRRGWPLVITLALAIPGLLTLNAIIGERLQSVWQSRVVELLGSGIYDSGRGELRSIAIYDFQESPLIGSGLGGYGVDISVIGAYPHNLILEIAGEQGIVGLLLLFATLALGLAAFWANRGCPYAIPYLALAVSVFVGAMVSGDFFDSRLLWFALLYSGASFVVRSSGEPGLIGTEEPLAGSTIGSRSTSKTRDS